MSIRTFAELHEALSHFTGVGKRWLFRGHSCADWKLVPKAARINWRIDDLFVLDTWRRRAIQFATNLPETDWDWVAVAQHHGLATRLLDWSLNPLTAAFFALEDETGLNPTIHAFAPNKFIDTATTRLSDFTGVGEYRPRGVTQRISHQIAVFTVHGPPSVEITAAAGFGALHTLAIDHNSRASLLRELDFYGVNRQALFPDLDGLSAYVNWFFKNDVLHATTPYG